MSEPLIKCGCAREQYLREAIMNRNDEIERLTAELSTARQSLYKVTEQRNTLIAELDVFITDCESYRNELVVEQGKSDRLSAENSRIRKEAQNAMDALIGHAGGGVALKCLNRIFVSGRE